MPGFRIIELEVVSQAVPMITAERETLGANPFVAIRLALGKKLILKKGFFCVSNWLYARGAHP